jgi:putative transposase
MTRYRRAFVPGATYFFTVNLADRRTTLLVDHIDLLREAIRYARQQYPFAIDATSALTDGPHIQS